MEIKLIGDHLNSLFLWKAMSDQLYRISLPRIVLRIILNKTIWRNLTAINKRHQGIILILRLLSDKPDPNQFYRLWILRKMGQKDGKKWTKQYHSVWDLGITTRITLNPDNKLAINYNQFQIRIMLGPPTTFDIKN